ncbi:GNAT family N-acetyltransferase [Glutamicibacter sp. NPDC055491]
MTLSIEPADFEDPSLGAFLEAHLADMAPQSPLESQHALDLGCSTPANRPALDSAEGPAHRGHLRVGGIGAGPRGAQEHADGPGLPRARRRFPLLFHALEDAAQRKLPRISLETGAMEFFAPARSLYRKHGFKQCQPFGSYREDPNSIYITRIPELK